MYWVSQNLSCRASGLRHLGELGKRFGSFSSQALVSTSSAWREAQTSFLQSSGGTFVLRLSGASLFSEKHRN